MNNQNYTIYHNPRCKKSRAGLQFLIDKGIDPEIIEYLKDPSFTIKTLTEVLAKLGLSPKELVRTQEVDFKQNYKGKDFSNEEWIKILVENPKLIQRPIIVKENEAVLGDPIENINNWMK